MAEHVVDADACDRRRALLGKHRRNSLAETTDDVVLLHRDDTACLFRRRENKLLVKRLDRVDVDNLRADALGLQRLRGLDRLGNHQAGRNDRDVRTLTERDALAELEAVVVAVVDAFHSEAAQTDVARALVLDRRTHGRLHLVVVARVEDDHARDRAHQGDILAALVRRAVLADGDARMGADDLDVQLRIADRVAHLLERSARREHRKGRRERDLSAGRKARRNTDHVALRDAAVKEAFRIFFLEDAGFRGRGKIRVQHNDIGIFGGQLRDRLAKALSCSLLYHFSHISSPPVPAMQR